MSLCDPDYVQNCYSIRVNDCPHKFGDTYLHKLKVERLIRNAHLSKLIMN